MNQPVTNRDIKIARKAHSTLFIEPEPGVIYVPPGMGQTSAGTGIQVIRVSDYYADLISIKPISSSNAGAFVFFST